MVIREIKTSDATEFAYLTQKVESSSEYMLWEAEERIIQPEQQLKIIESMLQSENSTILVVENENKKLVGYLMIIGGKTKRNKHTAYIVIGFLKDYRGQGLGTKLFKEMESWVSNQEIQRLELTVVTKNKAGLSLYQKMGFEIEGTKRNSLLINDTFVDEYYMSKLI